MKTFFILIVAVATMRSQGTESSLKPNRLELSIVGRLSAPERPRLPFSEEMTVLRFKSHTGAGLAWPKGNLVLPSVATGYVAEGPRVHYGFVVHNGPSAQPIRTFGISPDVRAKLFAMFDPSAPAEWVYSGAGWHSGEIAGNRKASFAVSAEALPGIVKFSLSGEGIDESARLSQEAAALDLPFDSIEELVSTAAKFRFVDVYAIGPKLAMPATFQDLIADIRDTASIHGLEQFAQLSTAEDKAALAGMLDTFNGAEKGIARDYLAALRFNISRIQ